MTISAWAASPGFCPGVCMLSLGILVANHDRLRFVRPGDPDANELREVKSQIGNSLFTFTRRTKRLFRDLYEAALRLVMALELLLTEKVRRHAADVKAHTNEGIPSPSIEDSMRFIDVNSAQYHPLLVMISSIVREELEVKVEREALGEVNQFGENYAERPAPPPADAPAAHDECQTSRP